MWPLDVFVEDASDEKTVLGPELAGVLDVIREADTAVHDPERVDRIMHLPARMGRPPRGPFASLPEQRAVGAGLHHGGRIDEGRGPLPVMVVAVAVVGRSLIDVALGIGPERPRLIEGRVGTRALLAPVPDRMAGRSAA